MLGGRIGKVAPDFAPAARAVGILDAHEDGDALRHRPEGRADRLLDGGTEDVGFGAGKRGGTHSNLMSFSWDVYSAACWLAFSTS